MIAVDEMVGFDVAWQKASQVTGWLSEGEAALLYDAAMQTPANGHIVEIGAFRGRSTTLLAESGRNLLTIDPLVPGTGCDDGTRAYEFGDDAAANLQSVIDNYPNAEWARCKSLEVECDPEIDLLYIDGEHRHPCPINDFWHFYPKVRDGALVAFHDFRDGKVGDGRTDPGVDNAVLALERMGHLRRIAHRGSMYLGRKQAKRQEVFLGQPYYGAIHPRSEESITRASRRVKITKCQHPSSLLAHGFNVILGTCLNRGGFDYFLVLHADVQPLNAGWLDTLIDELECNDLDAIHAACAIKDCRGRTSTAFSRDDDIWAHRRLITTTELHSLPPTFTIDDIREHLDPQAKVLLPNTGCLLLRIGEWLDRFPGFTIADKLGWKDGRRVADTVPEDWRFGFWCAANGVRVGCTRFVMTKHYGEEGFGTDHAWGEPRDETYFKKIAEANGHAS